jgi:hypothetical protein
MLSATQLWSFSYSRSTPTRTRPPAIYSMRALPWITSLAALIFPASTALGGQIIAQNSGLAGTDHLIDFGANVYPNFTVITTEFPPLTVAHARYYTTGSVNNINGGFLTNDFSGSPDTLSITFATPISDLSFVYHQINSSQPSVFRALLGGVLVDSFSNTSDQFQSNNYFGFTDLHFDELQLDFVSDFNVDEFAFNDSNSSAPGVPYCFGDGSGISCPCSALGSAGEGCLNTSGAGALLSASGSASLSSDTFALNISGVPGAKPGLVLRGNNQVAVPAGDGILCTTGGSQRSHVQTTVAGATTFTDFNGAPFGSVANAGVATQFQFWYRDPSNQCSGAGFNFSNGWSVTYQP